MQKLDHTYHPLTREFCVSLPAEFDRAATQNTGKITWKPRPFSTDLEPPTSEVGFVNVFEDGVWIKAPDCRGQNWFFNDRQEGILFIGDPTTFGYTRQPAEPVAPPNSSAAPVVYPYDQDGVYLGKPVHQTLDVQATLAKNEVIWADVPNSTDIMPPAPQDKQVAVWDKDTWGLEPDHRGEIWYDAKGNPVTVDFIGNPDDFDLIDADAHRAKLDAQAEIERLARVAAETDAAALAAATAKANATITAYQARMALNPEDLASFETALALPENRAAKTSWEYETDYKRSAIPLSVMTALLKWSDAQVAAFFDHALTL